MQIGLKKNRQAGGMFPCCPASFGHSIRQAVLCLLALGPVICLDIAGTARAQETGRPDL